MTTALAPIVSSRRRVRSPIREMAPSLCLPPVDFCLGVSPTQAAKCRPALKVRGSGAQGHDRRGDNRPTPGMVISRRASGSTLARRAISVSSTPDLLVPESAGSRRARVAPTWRPAARGVRILDPFDQPGHVRDALGGGMAILGQMAPQGVDGLGALAHEQVARAEHHAAGLLLFVLHRREPHARPLRGLADRLGVGRVVLLPP